MKYKIYDNCVKLIDSYLVSKKDFQKQLTMIRNLHPNIPLWNRSDASIKREWATHNLLYSLGIARERTKDCDLNYEHKWYMKIAYGVVGSVALLIIK